MPEDTSEHGSSMRTRVWVCVSVCGCEPVHRAAYSVHLCAQDGLAACEVGLWVHVITAVWG